MIYRCDELLLDEGGVRYCNQPAAAFGPRSDGRHRLYCGWHAPVDARPIELIDSVCRSPQPSDPPAAPRQSPAGEE